MRLASISCYMLLLTLASPVVVGADGTEPAAESAALTWLSLVDAGNYAQSWSAAATFFRQQVSQSQWQAAAAGARGPLGALKSRQLLSAMPTHSLPGAPDGDYVVVRFASSFEHKTTAVETITPMKDADGAWHVAGYFIQ
jgi:Protein of unknown function (DUF4019)